MEIDLKEFGKVFFEKRGNTYNGKLGGFNFLLFTKEQIESGELLRRVREVLNK